MEALDMKLRHLTAAPTAESFFPFPPVEHTARKIFMKGKVAVHRLASMLMSRFATPAKIRQLSLCQGSYAKDALLKKGLYTLANNPATSPGLLDYISTGSAVIIPEPVLVSVAMNENTPRSTLRRLANHDSPLVRAAVTENRYAPIEIISLLCQDEHPDVRFTIADNPDIPKPLLAKLAIDDNPYIAARACNTLERLDCNRSVPSIVMTQDMPI
jgi:hypothetical protein